MTKREFDYYLFIDYSENLIGYLFLGKNELKKCLLASSRFKHYREIKNRKTYLKHIKPLFYSGEILSCFLKKKIRNIIDTPEIFSDITKFLVDNCGKNIFISIDDRQYKNFEKFVKIFDKKSIFVIKEGKLKRDGIEYKINLILDTWLNLERTK